MNCADWEREIASESDNVALGEHLQGCERCQEFAREIEANRVAMGALNVPPVALDAVRRRVLDEIQVRKRRSVWWAWSAVAAACVAVLCVSYFVTRVRSPVAPKPVRFANAAPIMEHAPTPMLQASAKPHHRGRKRQFGAVAVKAAPPKEPLVIKMLTNDPNVIIIWLVDQKGDSL